MKWPEVTISRFCKTGSGGTPSTRQKDVYYGGDIPWVKSGELKENVLISTEESLSDLGLKESAAKWVPEGAILMAMYGASVGNTALLGLRATTNQAVCHVVPDPRVAYNRYVWYALRAKVPMLLTKRVGGAQPNISQKIIRDTTIALPAISEQRRIVEILDQADALRKQRSEADAKAARILPSLFYKMFGDPLALLNSGDGVPLTELDVDLQNGFACGEKDVEDGVPHLRMNNIDDAGVLNLDLIRTVPLDRDVERYRLIARDVLFMGTNSEEKIGKTCLFVPPDDRPFLFSNHLIRLRVSDKRITPEYLSAFLHLLWSKGFFPSIAKRWVNQASVAQSALETLRIPIPDRGSLRTFTAGFQDLLSLRAQRVRSGQHLYHNFSVLMHRAFTGNLTAEWREAHMKELLAEMEAQAKALGGKAT